MLSSIKHTVFNENDVFKIFTSDGQVQDWVLYKIKIGKPMPDAARDPFSLIFKSTCEAEIEQGIYKFEHASIGSLDLFVVPVVAPFGKGESFYYQVCFS